MAKKQNSSKELTLEQILWNCRDILRNKVGKADNRLIGNVDWSTRNDIKDPLRWDLTILLYKNGYPPQWDEEVFTQGLEQAENFKKYSE